MDLGKGFARAGVGNGLGIAFPSDEFSADQEPCFQSLRRLRHERSLRRIWESCQEEERGAGDGD